LKQGQHPLSVKKIIVANSKEKTGRSTNLAESSKEDYGSKGSQ
jgi:hypothetical protein